ncbi:MAG TPA: hypothetical protein VIN39_01935 [Candidatus Dormibacteraeota bacterium]
MQALEHQDGDRDHEDAEADVHQRDDERDAAQRGIPDQHMPEPGPRLGEDRTGAALSDRLPKARHQGGRNDVDRRGGDERQSGTGQGGQRARQRRAGADRDRVGDAVQGVRTIPQLLGHDQR